MALRLMLGAFALATTALTTTTAHAFFPFITDDAGTQGQGGNQIELNYEFVKEHNNELDLEGRVIGTGSGVANVFPAGYTYGIDDNIDIFVGFARQTSPVNGWLNTEIGAKWVFAGDQSSGWSAAVKPMLILPVTKDMQDRGLGNAKVNLGITMVGSYMADTHELHLNLDYTGNNYAATEQAEAQRKSLWRISAAPVYIINERWKAGIDVGLETNPSFNSHYQAFGEIGIQYAPRANMQIGLGIIGATALNSPDNGWSYTITTGIAYQF
ncbi:MAG: hypothetical protein LRY53_02210 [Burkholderiaceae bacterium]|nr:hypothetical protein [Burkholderiaceae bacterium]MCD8537064.1 hypothetical protein [Burkholderiaceae bacterium]MCD8564476.1 hypothetical protein [Burkholderiaceae bacterium]